MHPNSHNEVTELINSILFPVLANQTMKFLKLKNERDNYALVINQLKKRKYKKYYYARHKYIWATETRLKGKDKFGFVMFYDYMTEDLYRRTPNWLVKYEKRIVTFNGIQRSLPNDS